jgi:hypothetical protein
MKSTILIAFLLAAGCSDSKKSGGELPAEPGASEGPAGEPTTAPTGAESAGAAAIAPAPLPSDPGGKKAAHIWSVRMGGGEAESGRAIAVDPKGNVYVSGIFRDTVDFGDGKPIAANGVDGFVARLGPDGKLAWVRRMGGEGDDIADTVAVDPKGNVIVAGAFSSELELGDGKLTSKGSDDMFVAALDPNGRRLWAKRFGGPDSDGVDGIAVDAGGNIAVIGSYRSEMEVPKKVLVSEGDVEIALLLLGPDGEVKWSYSWGAIGPDEGRSVAFDKDGNLFVLVEFSRTVDFGGGALKSAGNRDLGLIKLDPSGKHIWSRRFGSQLDELGIWIATDPSGSVVMTGSFDDVLDLGDGAPMKTAGLSDVFVARFGPDGKTLWAQRLGDKHEDIGAAVGTDAYGNVYAAGWFWNQIEVGGATLKSNGKKDMFLVAWTPGGAPLWSKTFGAAEDDYARAVAVDGGAVYAAGTFHVSLNLGGTDLKAQVAPDAKIPYGDVFVAKWER